MSPRINCAIAVALSVTFIGACRLGAKETNRIALGGNDGDANASGQGGMSSAGSGGAGGASGASGASGQSAGDDGGASTTGGEGGTSGAGTGGSGGMPDSGSSGSGSASGTSSDDDGGTAGGGTTELTDCTYDAVQSHGGHSYYFCSNYASWTVARDLCADAEGSLVVIDDADENSFLVEQFGPHPSWWIGANDETAPDDWRWVDGADNDGPSFCTGNQLCSPVNGHYVNFAVGEPNAVSTESCAAIQSTGTWSDEYCVVAKPFICELDGEP